MGRFFFISSAVLFFFAAINVTIIPNPTAWGLVALAVGLAVGGWSWTPWKKSA